MLARLPYEPLLRRAVTAYGSDYFMVGEGEPPTIHVYTADGAPVTTIEHTELKIEADDCLHEIRCSADGVLHLAVGEPGFFQRIKSLHAYKVSSRYDLNCEHG